MSDTALWRRTGSRPWRRRPEYGIVDDLAGLLGPFTCGHCGAPVHPAGLCDDHCPACLWSRHVMFGRRPCGTLMEPAGVFPGPGGADWNVVWHRCMGCGFEAITPAAAAGPHLTRAMWLAATWDREP